MTIPRMNCPRLSTFAALAVLTAVPALAQDHGQEVIIESQEELALEPAGSAISGVIGADLFSHFVSYGQDVFAEGEPFTGSETFNPYAEIGMALGDFNLAVGIWGDINDNATSGLGNEIQEIDVYASLSTSIDDFSVGVVYQEWAFAGQTEKIIDVNLGYDDSEFWGDSGFSISPSLTIHNRIDNGLGLSNGTILVLGGEFGIDTGESPVSLAVPVAVAFVLDQDYFIPGGDDGFGYFSVGLSAGYGLGDLLGPEYGDWALNAGATWFQTEDSVYENPREGFLVLNVGVSLSF